MHKHYALKDGRVVECNAGQATVFVYYDLDEEEKRFLLEELKLDEHTLGSSFDPYELGRMEYEPEHAAIIFKRPKRYTAADNFLFKVTTTGFFLFADKLIILGDDDPTLFDGRIFTRLNTVSDLLLRLLFRSIMHFTEHLRVMNLISEELEDKVNTAMENRHLLHMFTLEKGLVYYLNAISSNGRVLEKIKANAPKLNLAQDSLEYLDDVLIENAQCFEQANTYAQVLASLMDARASLVSNNLNVMMKNLNAIVIAVGVPSFFVGMGGMSEFSAIASPEHRFVAYGLFFLSMVGVGVATFFLIQKIERHWR